MKRSAPVAGALVALAVLLFAGGISDRVLSAFGAHPQHTTVGFGVNDPEQVAGGVTFGERVTVFVENDTASMGRYQWRSTMRGKEIETGTVVVAPGHTARFMVTAPKRRGLLQVAIIEPERVLHWRVGP